MNIFAMVEKLILFCTSSAGLFWFVVLSDLAIAVAYFAIPITMAVVLRHRRADIPYPWLWILFVTFIVACGLTHVVHVWTALSGFEHLEVQASISVATALASVATALAFSWILPQIKALPSPGQQRRLLEVAVAQRTAEKDNLIAEISHRIGNQLQVLNALVALQLKSATADETKIALTRLHDELEKMGRVHLKLSEQDYWGASREHASVVPVSKSWRRF